MFRAKRLSRLAGSARSRVFATWTCAEGNSIERLETRASTDSNSPRLKSRIERAVRSRKSSPASRIVIVSDDADDSIAIAEDSTDDVAGIEGRRTH
jgi:hypothetical protein